MTKKLCHQKITPESSQVLVKPFCLFFCYFEMANSSSVDSISLDIKDNRTGEIYIVPIFRNTIRAVDLKQIVAASSSRTSTNLHAEGLRVVDEGFRNTAPVFSKISHL